MGSSHLDHLSASDSSPDDSSSGASSANHSASTDEDPLFSGEDHTGSFMIDLRIHTDDPRRRELIKRYWTLDERGSDFDEPFSDLKEDFGLARGGIVGIVRSDSTAVSGVHRCTGCGRRKTFDCRKEFRDTPTQKAFVCERCAEKGRSSSDERDGSDLGTDGEEKIDPRTDGPQVEPKGAARREGALGEVETEDVSSESTSSPHRHSLQAAAQSLDEARRHLEGIARQAVEGE